STMKVAVILALVLVISVFICLQTDATRSPLAEMKREKANDQPSQEVPKVGKKLELQKTGTIDDNKPEDNQENTMPAAADSKDQTSKSNAVESDNNVADENNDNYGAYGSPSDSSTESHHRFKDDNRPHQTVSMKHYK
ncbi:hypothetical protein ACH5RR_001650, partial [Cinchona calisaya]